MSLQIGCGLVFTSMWRVIKTRSKKAFYGWEQWLALHPRRMESQPRHWLLSMTFLALAPAASHHANILPGLQTRWHTFSGPAGAGNSPVPTSIQSILSVRNLLFIANSSRALLILSILFHPWQLESFQVALTTCGVELFSNGKKRLS